MTIVPSLNASEQSCVLVPQEMPGPLTRPDPPTVTVRIFWVEPWVNVAVSDLERS